MSYPYAFTINTIIAGISTMFAVANALGGSPVGAGLCSAVSVSSCLSVFRAVMMEVAERKSAPRPPKTSPLKQNHAPPAPGG